MTATRTIVVGYDGSASARAAVEAGVERAGPDGRVVLVNAFHVPPDYMGAPFYQEMLTDETRRTQKEMRELELSCKGLADIAHETEVLGDDPAHAILAVAETHGADEIVLGSSGRGRFGTLIHGSVAQKVKHRAHCPVVVMGDRMGDEKAPAPSGTGTD